VKVGPVGDDAVAFQDEVLSLLPAFWGERDVQHLHHPVWFRQFGEAAFAARDGAGILHGYLLGARTPRGGYAHVIATLPAVRTRGTGRALYARFAAQVAADGGTTVEAITVPTNTGSVAFHQRLGFIATLVEHYAGPGQDRIHFAVHARTLLDG
jgi:L-amino acid N-acyltransferase YncA